MAARLIRFRYLETATIGILVADEQTPAPVAVKEPPIVDYDPIIRAREEFLCYTLERPYKNNESFVSCIPSGLYQVVPYSSPKHKDCYVLLDVPEREDILIHVGNYPWETEGCIFPGLAQAFKNERGKNVPMVISSGAAMGRLRERFGRRPWWLEVYSRQGPGILEQVL